MHRVLDIKTAALPSDTGRFYHLLGAVPLQAFSTGSAAAVLGRTPEECAPLLATLVDADLLQTPVAGTFQFFPMTLSHAREDSQNQSQSEVEAALERLTAWYSAGAINAAGAIRPYRREAPELRPNPQTSPPQFPSLEAALGWLEREAPQIYALAEHLEGRNDRHAGYTLLSQLWALWAYRKDYPLWEACDALALRCADRTGDADGQARMLRRLGMLCAANGRYTEARAFLENAAAIFEDLDDDHRLAGVLNTQGVLLRYEDDLEGSVAKLTEAQRMYGELGDERALGLVAIDLAATELVRQRFESALPLLQFAAEYLDGSPDVFTLARRLALVGRAHGQMGESEQARDELDRAIAQMRACGSTTGLAEATIYLAEVAQADREPLVVHRLLHEAEGLLDEAGMSAKGWLRVRMNALSSA